MNLGGLESMNKILNKYQPIFFSLILVLIFLSAREQFDNNLWHWIDAIVTILTVTGVWYNYNQNQKQLEKIEIYLEFDDGYIETIYPIKRKNFSRAELKGILRELHNSRENYELSYMSEDEFLENIFKVQDGLQDKFYMKIRKGDIFEHKRNDDLHKTNI